MGPARETRHAHPPASVYDSFFTLKLPKELNDCRRGDKDLYYDTELDEPGPIEVATSSDASGLQDSARGFGSPPEDSDSSLPRAADSDPASTVIPVDGKQRNLMALIPRFEKKLKPFRNLRRKLSKTYWQKYYWMSEPKDISLIHKSLLLDQWVLGDPGWDQEGAESQMAAVNANGTANGISNGNQEQSKNPIAQPEVLWSCAWKHYELWRWKSLRNSKVSIEHLRHTVDYIIRFCNALEEFYGRDHDSARMDGIGKQQQKLARARHRLLKCYFEIYQKSKDVTDLENAILAGTKCIKMQHCPPWRREKVFWAVLYCMVDTMPAEDKSLIVADRVMTLLEEYTELQHRLPRHIARHIPIKGTHASTESIKKIKKIPRHIELNNTSVSDIVTKQNRRSSNDEQAKETNTPALCRSCTAHKIPPDWLLCVAEVLYQHYQRDPVREGPHSAAKVLDYAIEFQDYGTRDIRKAGGHSESEVTIMLRYIELLVERYKRTRINEGPSFDRGTAFSFQKLILQWLKDRVKGGLKVSDGLWSEQEGWVYHWGSVLEVLYYDQRFLFRLDWALDSSLKAVRAGRDLLSEASDEKSASVAALNLLTWTGQLEEVMVRRFQYYLDHGNREGCAKVMEDMKTQLQELCLVKEKKNPVDTWIGKAQALLARAWLKYLQYTMEVREVKIDVNREVEKNTQVDEGRNKLLKEAIKEGMQAYSLSQELVTKKSDPHALVEAIVCICLGTFHLARYRNDAENREYDLQKADMYSQLALKRSKADTFESIHARHVYVRACHCRAHVLSQQSQASGQGAFLREAIQYQRAAVRDAAADKVLLATCEVALGEYEALLLGDPDNPEVEEDNAVKQALVTNQRIMNVVEVHGLLLRFNDPYIRVHFQALLCTVRLCTERCKSTNGLVEWKDYLEMLIEVLEIHLKPLTPPITGFDRFMILEALGQAQAVHPDMRRCAISNIQSALDDSFCPATGEKPAKLKYCLGNLLMDQRRSQQSDAPVEATAEQQDTVRRKLLGVLKQLSWEGSTTAFEIQDAVILEPLLSCLTSEKAPTKYRLKAAVTAAGLLQELKRWNLLYTVTKLAMALVHLLSLKALSQHEQHSVLKSISGLGSVAAAAALDQGEKHAEEALMLLETGRDLIAGNYFDTRVDFSALGFGTAHPELDETFDQLSNMYNPRADDDNPRADAATGIVAHESSWDKFSLSKRFDELVKIITAFGKKFLAQQPEIEDMIAAAKEGSIVVINIASWRCDAFIIGKKTRVKICRLPDLNCEDILAYANNRGGNRNETMWVWMWRTMANPILQALGYTEDITTTLEDNKTNMSRLDDPSRRIWWVMTGNASRLPIHAAVSNNGANNIPPSRVVNRVVSSYTTSIKALRFARQQFIRRCNLISARPARGQGHAEALVCGLRSTSRNAEWSLGMLAMAVAEAGAVERVLRAKNTIYVTKWTEPDAKSIVNALSPLVDDVWTPSIFHFAGHGYSSPNNPFASAIYLYDERLDVSMLLKARVWHAAPMLAYLSACSTRVPTSSTPDEGVNIMSGFLAAGFLNVIGTLWLVGDELSASVAAQVYLKWATQTKPLDPEKLAWCLQAAIVELGVDKGMEEDQWACYVHTGI